MYSADFNVPLLDLNKKPIEEGKTLGKLLGQVLVQEAKGDAIKIYGWGITLYEDKPLTLDTSDWQMLYDLINGLQHLAILAKAPALKILLDAKHAVKS